MIKKKKGLKIARRRLIFFIAFFFAASIFLGASVFNVWLQIFDNNHTILELTTQYNKLLEEEKKLESDVYKLQDPEYMARYARERYMYTKDGEIIIKMQSED